MPWCRRRAAAEGRLEVELGGLLQDGELLGELVDAVLAGQDPLRVVALLVPDGVGGLDHQVVAALVLADLVRVLLHGVLELLQVVAHLLREGDAVLVAVRAVQQPKVVARLEPPDHLAHLADLVVHELGSLSQGRDRLALARALLVETFQVALDLLLVACQRGDVQLQDRQRLLGLGELTVEDEARAALGEELLRGLGDLVLDHLAELVAHRVELAPQVDVQLVRLLVASDTLRLLLDHRVAQGPHCRRDLVQELVVHPLLLHDQLQLALDVVGRFAAGNSLRVLQSDALRSRRSTASSA